MRLQIFAFDVVVALVIALPIAYHSQRVWAFISRVVRVGLWRLGQLAQILLRLISSYMLASCIVFLVASTVPQYDKISKNVSQKLY